MNVFLENDFLKVEIKEKGAELKSAIGKQTGFEYIWRGDPAFWGKTSPILFPIVGTLKNDAYLYKGNSYLLTRHGFARDFIFQIEEQKKDWTIFLLRSSQTPNKNYPFEFELRIKYTLAVDILEVTYDVRNIGRDAMYFSIGGHPAFKVPLVEGSSYEDYFLEFNEPENLARWPINAQGLIMEEPIPLLTNASKLKLTRSLFNEDALVFKKLKSNRISIKSSVHNHGLDFYFDGFPYLGIWAAPNADFVCIEPWCGIADSVLHDQQLTTKEGIQKISNREPWFRMWKVRFF
jgi:galactose mutarotase-like enzyme